MLKKFLEVINVTKVYSGTARGTVRNLIASARAADWPQWRGPDRTDLQQRRERLQLREQVQQPVVRTEDHRGAQHRPGERGAPIAGPASGHDAAGSGADQGI